MLYRAEGRAKEGKQGKTWREGERVMKRSDRRGGENRPGLGADFNLVITRTNVLLVWAGHFPSFPLLPQSPLYTPFRQGSPGFHHGPCKKAYLDHISLFDDLVPSAFVRFNLGGSASYCLVNIYALHTCWYRQFICMCVCEFVFARVNVCALTQFSAVPQCLTCLSLVYLPFGSV